MNKKIVQRVEFGNSTKAYRDCSNKNEIFRRRLGRLKKETSETMSNTQTIRSADFTASRAWGALDIANMNGTTVRLHWTDQPYKWHVNDGEEVFAVMDGEVDMHYRENGEEHIVRLKSGDIFYAGIGTEHVAHPCGEARILVIEKEGSV